MNAAARLVISLVVRLILLFYAGWFAVADSALHPDASLVSRIGLSLLFLILSLFVGEVTTLRMHVGMVLGALRKVAGGEGLIPEAVAAEVGAEVPPDASASAGDAREAIDILVKTLSSSDEKARGMAYAHLQRLTGETLPEVPEAWERWWADNREGFVPPGA